jgi:hypothetical protein
MLKLERVWFTKLVKWDVNHHHPTKKFDPASELQRMHPSEYPTSPKHHPKLDKMEDSELDQVRHRSDC